MRIEVIEAVVGICLGAAWLRALLGRPISIVRRGTQPGGDVVIPPVLLFVAVVAASVALIIVAVNILAVPASSGKGFMAGILLGVAGYIAFLRYSESRRRN